ncbi:MAG TPA: phytanoyl-CoA dioxygenase family protein [Solirubrobacteraceae bacterium]
MGPSVEAFDGTLAEALGEIERLTVSNRANPNRETERRLVRLRNIAGMLLTDEAPDAVDFVAPASDGLPEGDPLPEVDPSQLDAGLIRAGILRDGCLLVRGLVPRDRAEKMAKQIDAAFAQRERYDAGRSVQEGYYEEFIPDPRAGEPVVRGWIKQGGGLLAADAPALHFEMMELFGGAGLRELVGAYLGEPALISVHKTTLRKAEPSVPGAWHQDGFFMGEVRSLNMWLSLSRCGDEAPGLDVLPTRLEHYLATNTEEAALDYTISQRKVDETRGEVPVVRPLFEPGDAIFFDEKFLHQTGSDPSMRKPRYAIENWFFGGSAFPGEYAPIAV